MGSLLHRIGQAITNMAQPPLMGIPVVNSTPPAAPKVPAQPRNSAPSTPFGTGSNGITTNATFTPLQLHQMRPYERIEGLKISRWLDNNLPLVGAINDNSVSYAIGNGVDDYAATGDPDYDESADKFIKSIFEDPEFDVAGEQSMPELTNAVVRGMIVDGDAGAAHILERDSQGRPLRGPQLQLFTSDQISNGYSFGSVTGVDYAWQDGIRRNAVGKAEKYRIVKYDPRQPSINVGTWDYERKDFLLVLDRKRIQQGRGIQWCHRANRSAQSMLNLGALAEAREHINALFAAIITTPTGETPEALEAFVVNQFGTNTSEKVDGTVEQKKVLQRYVELMGGAKVPVFEEGTKLDAYTSNGNSHIYTGAMDYLATQIALSYTMPIGFIWSLVGAGKGPDIRMTLAQGSWYFNRILVIAIRRFIKPVRDALLKYGLLTGKINDGRLPRNGADYRLATFHGPRDITIDERYYHKTWLDRLADGKGTEEEYYSLQGQNGDTQARKRIKEIGRRKKWCIEEGIDYHGDYIRSAPGTNIGGSTDPKDPDEEEAKQKLLEQAA